MSIDVASLVFEIDSTQAVTARERLEGLEAAGTKVDATARRVKTATEQAGIGMEKIASGSARAAKAATEHAQAQGVVEKATDRAGRAATMAAEREVAAWAKVEAALGRRNSAYRGDLAAQSATEATKAAIQEAVAWGRVEAALDKRNAALRGDLAAEQAMEAAKAAHTEAAAWGEVEAALERRNAEYRAAAALASAKGEVASIMAVEQAAEQEAIAWTKVETALEKRNAALRGDIAVEQALAAARAAEDEAQAWAKVEAALERRNAELRESNLIATMKAEAAAVGALESRIDRLMNSLDPTRAAQSRLNAEMQEASALYKMGAISASDYAKATSVLESRMGAAARGQTMLNGVMVRGAASSKHVTLAGLDLSRQFADIAVTGAMGMNPFMILIQQGPQIVDRLAQMKMEGIGLAAVLKGMGAAILPFLPALAVIGTVATVAFGGAALAARALNKDNENLVNSLGLTQKQLDHLKDKGVNTSVTIGDVFRGTFNYIRDGIAPALAPIGKWFSDLFDGISSAGVATVKVVGGAFVGAYAAIKATWSALPAALGDIAVQTGNAVVRAIEDMLNKALAAYNKALPLIRGLMMATGNGAGAMALREAGPVDLGQMANPWTGAAGKAIADGTAAFKKANDEWSDTVDSVGNGLRKSILDAAGKRIEKLSGDAGKAPKTPKGAATPRDMNDERLAELDKLLAQAAADELQARLALTEGTQARANIEKEILAAQMDVKRAELAKLTANAKDAKGISEATRGLMFLEIEAARISAERTGAMREELINRNTSRAITKETYAVDAAHLENQVDLLSSQRDVARYAYQRRALDLEILAAQQKIARMKLDEVIATTAANSVERQIAEDRKAELVAIQANQTRAAVGTFQDNFRDASDAFGDLVGAIKSKDWDRAVSSVMEAFGTFRDALKRGSVGGVIGSVAGLAGAAGQLIGGKVGGVLSGAASGAAAGSMIMPGIGTAIGAALGGISSLLSGNKAEKARKNQEAAAKAEAEIARVMQIANEKRDLEIEKLGLQGDATAALARSREIERNATDAGNRALLDEVNALRDAKTHREFEIRLMKASGDAIGALAAERALERATVTAANLAIFDQIVAMEDATERVSAAKDVLSQAVEREMSALERSRDGFQTWAKSLKDFLKDLTSGPRAMLSPEEQYRTAKAAFDKLEALPVTDQYRLENIQSVSQEFNDASKAYYASSKGYFADTDRIRAAVTASQAYAEAQVSLADQQLAALHAQTDGILGVQAAVLSVRDALAAYQSAVASQIAAAQTPAAVPGGAANDNGATRQPDWNSYVSHYSDVAAEYARNMGSAKGRDYLAGQGVTDLPGFGKWHWDHYGKNEPGRVPYATGGIMDRPMTLGESGIGGEAGPEGLLPLANVGGKMGVHATIGVNDELVKEVRGLRAELAEVKRELKAANVQRGAGTAELLDGVSRLEKATKKTAVATTRSNARRAA